MKQPVLSAFSGAFLLGAAMVLPGEAAEVTIEAVNKAVAAIEKKAEAEIAENAVAGMAIGVVFHDKLIYAKGFGVRDTATGEPIDPDTVFQIASLSKSVGSTVVAALVGEGKITWDSRISDLDPGFEMYSPFVTRELTIRDLYAHRSGLPDHAGDLLEDLGFSRGEILHRLRYQPPSSSFRAGYAYTNFGLTEGGIAAAKAYGLDWEVASEEKLYKPLGMTSTSSRYADFLARPNRARGHVLVDGKWVAKYQRDPDTESPAGGVSSSVNDLAKWIRLELANGKFEGKQVVAEAPLAETHLPQIMISASTASGIPGFYGLGWNVGYSKEGTLRLSHSGAFSYGTGTNVNMSPSDQLGIVILTNSAPTGVAEAIGAEFLDLATTGTSTRDWLSLYKNAFAALMSEDIEKNQAQYGTPPAAPLPAAANAAYVGTYTNDFFGDITVAEKDGGLVISQGPKPMIFAMTHFNRDTFTYITEGESAVGISGIAFTLGADGKATQVLVGNLDNNGLGTFQRKP